MTNKCIQEFPVPRIDLSVHLHLLILFCSVKHNDNDAWLHPNTMIDWLMIDPTADEDTSSLFLIMHQHISSPSCSLATDKECLYTEQIMTTSHSFHTLDQLHWLWCCVNLRSRNAVYQLYFQLYIADAWAAVNLACNCPCRLIFWGFSEINIGKTRTTNLNCLLKSVVVFLFFFAKELFQDFFLWFNPQNSMQS